MMGMERGFDLSSEEGMNEWKAKYNALIAAGARLRIPLPGEQSASAQQFLDKLKPGTTRRQRKRSRQRK
jgi:hypothetical protein